MVVGSYLNHLNLNIYIQKRHHYIFRQISEANTYRSHSSFPMAPELNDKVGGQAVLGRQLGATTPWLTERHGYDPT